MTSTTLIAWNVNGVVLSFLSGANVGAIDPGNITPNTSTVAYLVARTPDGSAFKWTSVVYYTPDPSIRGSVPVVCGGLIAQHHISRW